VLALAHPRREWVFSTELNGGAATFADLNIVGDGHAMAWNAGAEYTAMEGSYGTAGGFAHIQYGVGYPDNTWYGCSMVDANGTAVPWFDGSGRELSTVPDRFRPGQGQKFMLIGGGLVGSSVTPQTRGNYIDDSLAERIRNGELSLPLYADLPSLPEHERRAIFGLMVGNEGKSRVPVYETYTKAGFDPDRDMLQAPLMPPDAYRSPPLPPRARRSLSGASRSAAAWWWTGISSRASRTVRPPAAASTAAATIPARPPAAGTPDERRPSTLAAWTEAAVDAQQLEAEKVRVYAPCARGLRPSAGRSSTRASAG